MHRSARERNARFIRATAWTLLFLLGLILASLLDHRLWQWLTTDGSIRNKDWYLLLRSAGYFPTWLIVSAALILGGAHAGTRRPSRFVYLAASAAISGLAAELLKLIVARDRPGVDGLHHYRGLFAGFTDGSNLGMPSSHAAVAFGAAFAMLRLSPGAGWVLLPLAAGCGLTRLLMGDHFTSDVYVAAWLGWLCARLLLPSRSPHSSPSARPTRND